MKKLLPILLIVLFAGAGVAAGLALKPDDVEAELMPNPCGEDPNGDGTNPVKAKAPPTPAEAEENLSYEYVKLSNQFIVPVIKGDTVRSVAIVALSLEVKTGTKDQVFAVEPKLRDTFLQTLFDHASVGGFDGAFATTENLLRMRRSLKESAVAILGNIVNEVLVTDIARQDN